MEKWTSEEEAVSPSSVAERGTKLEFLKHQRVKSCSRRKAWQGDNITRSSVNEEILPVLASTNSLKTGRFWFSIRALNLLQKLWHVDCLETGIIQTQISIFADKTVTSSSGTKGEILVLEDSVENRCAFYFSRISTEDLLFSDAPNFKKISPDLSIFPSQKVKCLFLLTKSGLETFWNVFFLIRLQKHQLKTRSHEPTPELIPTWWRCLPGRMNQDSCLSVSCCRFKIFPLKVRKIN